MDEKKQYISIISEVIEKQSIILGPDIAKLKARNVSEIIFSENGEVKDINGDPAKVLQALINEYVNLSGQIVKNALSSIFEKYPSIKNVQ